MAAHVRKILIATDFSTPCHSAVIKAKELADAFGASLNVLHVVEEPFGYLGDLHAYLPEVDAYREELSNAARTALHQVLTPEEIQHYHAELALRTGTPYVEIVRYALKHAIDLVVVGSHGRGPWRQMLLGSVAEKVVRYATCPVLTVRP